MLGGVTIDGLDVPEGSKAFLEVIGPTNEEKLYLRALRIQGHIYQVASEAGIRQQDQLIKETGGDSFKKSMGIADKNVGTKSVLIFQVTAINKRLDIGVKSSAAAK